MMNIRVSVALLLAALLSTSVSADYIFNFVPDSDQAAAGTIVVMGDDAAVAGPWNGLTANNVALGDDAGLDLATSQNVAAIHGTLVQTDGVTSSGLSITADTDRGRTGDLAGCNQGDDDGGGHFDIVSNYFGSDIGRNFFWGRHPSDDSANVGSVHNVTISGLTPGDAYDVGVLAGSSRGGNMQDISVEGTTMAGLTEPLSEMAPHAFPGILASSTGTITIGVDSVFAPDNRVSLLQAVRITAVPEPASVALLMCGLLGVYFVRRR